MQRQEFDALGRLHMVEAVSSWQAVNLHPGVFPVRSKPKLGIVWDKFRRRGKSIVWRHNRQISASSVKCSVPLFGLSDFRLPSAMCIRVHMAGFVASETVSEHLSLLYRMCLMLSVRCILLDVLVLSRPVLE
jgi:hypothetical protein